MDVKELVRKSMDDWNNKDKEEFLANFTESSEITAPGGLVLCGLKGVEMFWEVWQGAFPDSQGTVSDLFAAGDRACHEGIFEGTHTGTLHGVDGSEIPPRGRQVSLRFAQVHTIRYDKFVTSHLYFDQVELLTQLDQMPTSGG